MVLTPAQQATLKAYVEADGTLNQLPTNSDGAFAIAEALNEVASPAFHIYRNEISAAELKAAIDIQDIVDITDADSARVVRILDIRSEIGFKGSDARDRSAFDDVFSAAAGDNSQQAILALWTRLGTVAEKLFRLNTGDGNAADTADTTSFQGILSYSQVHEAMQW